MRAVAERLLFAAIAVAAVACHLDPSEPGAGEVVIRVERDPAVELTSPLRYAVVWTLAEGMTVTADGEVGGPDLTGTRVAVPLELPAEEERDQLDPLEEVELVSWGDEYPAFRPRLVVYEDVDGDDAFAPPVLAGGGEDRVVGIDEGEVVALLDVETALEDLSLEEAAVFYRQTGEAFGSFFSYVAATSSYDDPSLGELDAVFVDIEDPELAELELECKHGLSAIRGYYNTAYFETIEVDAGLDPIAVCGLIWAQCAGRDFDAEPPPPLEPRAYPRPWRDYQCRQGTLLESLIRRETDIQCEACSCDWTVEEWIYVTQPTDPPAWWPCGEAVPYCESESESEPELFYFDESCPFAE